MLATATSGAVVGVEAFSIDVEVDVSPGLPAFNIVGLPEGAVRESRERIKAAIKNCGYPFPTQRITVNLAPADVRKDGSGLDLPMACAILCTVGVLPQTHLKGYCISGELSLDGSIKASRGILPLSIGCRGWEMDGFIVPEPNGFEAASVPNSRIYPMAHLSEVTDFLRNPGLRAPFEVDLHGIFQQEDQPEMDFCDVVGQEQAKRALEIAAAGGHNVLMIGPPGSGKTMLARRLPSILPPLTFEEAVETSCIYSVAGLLPPERPLVTQRPFCAPHHSISDAGLIGGGVIPRPGQVSLAHNGVLFLDELPEFKKNVLECLRQPMEDGQVTIARATQTLSFPARFSLVAAQNPCPCGQFGDRTTACTCHPNQIARYRSKISGPLLDRLDIQIEVPKVAPQELGQERRGETSRAIRERVTAARAIQRRRFERLPLHSNAQMSAREIRHFSPLMSEGRAFLEKVADRLALSARAYHRIIKIARTIADLAGSDRVETSHLAEAVQYRSLDRSGQGGVR